MNWQANTAVASSPETATFRSRLLPRSSQDRGIAHLNQQTGCFEYYGEYRYPMPQSGVTNPLSHPQAAHPPS